MNRSVQKAVRVVLASALAAPFVAQAQQAQPQTSELQEVVVTGIRFGLQQSLEVKREATSVVEVITAEDIGKMPDKNVADSLARVPGVTISSAGAAEGGFDEADRVSMRGTNPSLTQTLINGHNVASGDWFVLNQTGTVGRSVSYTLLPSELVSQVVVHKSSEADLVEGGVAGSVDIITRKPLDFKTDTTLEASAGAVHADLPGTTDPQFSALGNWINDAHNLGLLVQVFSETRHLRRDGSEILGYSNVTAGSAMATANPATLGAAYPVLIGAALFEQERERNGGLVDLEWKAADNLTVDASIFSSKLEATNVNYNYLLWGSHLFNGGNPTQPLSNYTLQNGTITSASFAAAAGGLPGIYDQISRPDESATSNFGNLDMKWKASDSLDVSFQLGTSRGDGRTPHQDVLETLPGAGNAAAYQLNGIAGAPNWNLGPTINTSPVVNGAPVAFSWIFGDQNVDVVDKETWGKIDAEYKMNGDLLTDLKFGVRVTNHDRSSSGVIGQGPLGGAGSNYPTGFSNYPANYGEGLGGTFPTGIWIFTPAQLAAYDLQWTNRDPVSRADFNSDYALHEHNSAFYVQGDFKGSGWSGNVGLRIVSISEDVSYNQGVNNAVAPGTITTSAFGDYLPTEDDHTYTEVLPSANLKFDVAPDVVARLALAQTMTMPDYSALAGPLNLTPPALSGLSGSGSGSNPDLKPIRSTNFDAGLEWYFQPRSMLAATVFYMNLENYVSYGSVTKNIYTFSQAFPNGSVEPYLVTVPINAAGKVDGIELAYQQAITAHTGIAANYTIADGTQTSDVVAGGTSQLVGTSRNTYNVNAYYENAHFSARVAYTYRSSFYSGLDRSTAFSQGEIGTLSASLGYTVNDNFSITLDGMNLNNPMLKYYAQNETQPRAFYRNGSQYYLNFRFKL
jgi:iron complex outermembrane recepter protein